MRLDLQQRRAHIEEQREAHDKLWRHGFPHAWPEPAPELLTDADKLAAFEVVTLADREADITEARKEYAEKCRVWFSRLDSETQARYRANPKKYNVPKEAIPLTMTEDINNHLTDLIKDITRVRKACAEERQACKDFDRPPTLTEDAIKSRLCNISNAFDDLYHEIVGS